MNLGSDFFHRSRVWRSTRLPEKNNDVTLKAVG